MLLAGLKRPGTARDREHDHFAKARHLVTNKPKYVNMADINLTAAPRRPAAADPAAKSGAVQAGEPIWDLIELLFFAYRDFVGDPDDALAKFNFGRAHHRVLHFVNRNPGMKVAALLDILKITKQSLGRVLKQLIDQGYIEQREGERDRRQRLLYATPKGAELALRLANLQTTRIARALGEVGPGAHEAARKFLTAMIDPEGRERVLRLIDRAERARRPRS
jgi:DNA-binding MarR family transcriptional regulator